MDYETIENEFERAIFIALDQLGERSNELSWFCKDDDSGLTDFIILAFFIVWNMNTCAEREYPYDPLLNCCPTPPEKIDGATHWALMPDDSVLYYKVGDEVLLWRPLSEVWDSPSLVPYTLHCFDDEEV